MPLKVGDTFFMSNTGGVNNPAGAHLMVCIALPQGKAIIIPIVSRHQYSDESCIIEVGDHPFVKHQSCASYDFARSISVAAIEAEIKSGVIKLREPVSDDLIKRIQVGFVKSDETEPWVFNEAGGTALTAYLKGKGYM